MCGIWGGDCDVRDSCNVYGHDYCVGECVYCSHVENTSEEVDA